MVRREEGKVLFYLTDNKLVIANTGMPFNKGGVDAICASDTSPKDASNDIWKKVREAVLPLQPNDTNGFLLSELRVPNNISIKVWESFKSWLINYHPNGLKDFFFLPIITESEERRHTLASLSDNSIKLNQEELKYMPYFPIDGDQEVKKISETDIFLAPETTDNKQPEKLPIPILFLSKEASKNIQANQELKEFILRIGVKEISLQNIIDTMENRLAETPQFIDKKPRALLNFLQYHYNKATEADRNNIRNKLANILKIKTNQHGWQYSNKVYAGKEWDNEALENLYPDRWFLETPPNKQSERERLKRFYQWFGVAWQPRIFKFKEDNSLKEWQNYKESIQYDVEDCTRISGRKNYQLDGDITIFKTQEAFNYFAHNWRNTELEKNNYKKGKLEYFFRSDKTHEYISYYRWCLENISWVAVKKDDKLYKPNKVFYGDVANMLQGWVYHLPEKYGDKTPFLDAIGVRSQWSKLKIADWQKWLKQAEEFKNSITEAQPKELIKKLYRNLLNHINKMEDSANLKIINNDIGLWAINRDKDNNETWQWFDGDNTDEIYYLDRPDLDKIRLEKLWILPVTLEKLEDNAEKYLNIQPLSEHIKGEIKNSNTDADVTKIVTNYLAERWSAIYAVLEKKYDTDSMESILKPKEDLFTKLNIQVANVLIVNFTIDGKEFGELDLSSYYKTHTDNEPAQLWLKKNANYQYDKISQDGLTEKSGGWDIAEALCYVFQLANTEKSSIKDILCSAKEDLNDLLIRFNITQETIDDINHNREKTLILVEPINNEEEDETPDEITNAEEQQTATEAVIAPDTTQSRSSYSSNYPNTSRNGARTSYDDVSPAPNQLENNTQKTISLIKIENYQNETQNNSSTNVNDANPDKETESEEHKQLIQKIKNEPSLVIENAEYYQHEQAISSPVITDKPDIILGDDDKIYIVEVKVYQTNNQNDDNNELRRGIFQCLRYRLAYKKLIKCGEKLNLPKYQQLYKSDGSPKAIIPVLAYNAEFPEAIKEVAKAENIKFETVL